MVCKLFEGAFAYCRPPFSEKVRGGGVRRSDLAGLPEWAVHRTRSDEGEQFFFAVLRSENHLTVILMMIKYQVVDG